MIKYVVVSVDTLCNDLLDWNTLCLSGRMHKPINILQDHSRARLAQHANLVPALRTALLLLPELHQRSGAVQTRCRLELHWRLPNAVCRERPQSQQHCCWTNSNHQLQLNLEAKEWSVNL